MRRIGASVLLGLVTSMVWLPAANAEETLPSETASESPAAQDLPSLDIPTGSPSGASTEDPTETPTEPATEPPTVLPTELPTEQPTASPTETVTDSPSDSSTESPTETPGTSPALPTQAPDARTALPTTVVSITAAQAVALAAAVMSPISMLTTGLFGAPYTPGSISTPTGGPPTATYAADDPSPSPSPSPTTTDDLTLSGSDTGTPVDDVRWGGLAIILLCAAAGLFGYRVARRGGPGTASHP
jgi:hypothetical protein